MKSQLFSTRFVFLLATIHIFQWFGASTAFSADALTFEQTGATKWAVKIRAADHKLKSVLLKSGSDAGQDVPLTEKSPGVYLLKIPTDLQKDAQTKVLSAEFHFDESSEPTPFSTKLNFKDGLFTKKPLPTELVIPPTSGRSASNLISTSPVKDSAEQLKKWILDRAHNWKVPGVAYFDHQPKKTSGAFSALFAKLAKEAMDSKDLSDAVQKNQKIKDLRQEMRDGLDKIYETRGVKEDWQPFLLEIQDEVGDSHSDQSASGAAAQGKFDLNNLEHIAAVFGAIAAAFSELGKIHQNVEKYFLGGGSLSGSGAGGGGTAGTQYGSGGSDDCRCRRRHRTCWSLLIGL